MAINYSYLRGRIKEKYGSEGKFAKSIGVTKECVSNVFRLKKPMSITLMRKCVDALNIRKSEIGKYFFTDE